MATYTLFGTDLRTIESAFDLAAHLDKHAPNGLTSGLVMGPYTVDVIDKDGDTELFVHNGAEWLSVYFDGALWTPLNREYAPYTLPGYGHREFQSKADLIQYLDGQITVPTTPVYANAQDLCNDMRANNGDGVWLWNKGIHVWPCGMTNDSNYEYVFVYDHGTWYRLLRSTEVHDWLVAGDNMDGKILTSYVHEAESPREFINRVSVSRGYTDYKVPMNFPVGTYAETEDVTTDIEQPLTEDDMASFEGGGVRSSDDGKPQFTHLMVTHMPYGEQPITRAAQRMAEGAERYGARNYEQFQDREAMERCYASLMRHVNQLGEEVFQGSRVDNEDHLAAVIANAVMLGSVMHRVYGE